MEDYFFIFIWVTLKPAIKKIVYLELFPPFTFFFSDAWPLKNGCIPIKFIVQAIQIICAFFFKYAANQLAYLLPIKTQYLKLGLVGIADTQCKNNFQLKDKISKGQKHLSVPNLS